MIFLIVFALEISKPVATNNAESFPISLTETAAVSEPVSHQPTVSETTEGNREGRTAQAVLPGWSGGELVKVVRVIDGDTIEIESGERVRYIGIDAPESVHPSKSIECFGKEASKKNGEMVLDKLVRLEKDISERDRYGRLLRYVWMGDILINLELVEQGFAYSYSYPPDVKYQDLFAEAQRRAREENRGLWGGCQEESPSAVASELPIASQNSAPPDKSCPIKGNINSVGEKIYHLPKCDSYEKTKIDESRGERWFCFEAEAQEAGWRRALNCPHY